jgi:hypothetical protein
LFLRPITNIADRKPGLIRGSVNASFQSSNERDFLIDVFAITNRAKMASHRAMALVKRRPFVKLFVGILQSSNVNRQLCLGILVFISDIVPHSDAAKALSEFGVVPLVSILFVERSDGLDTRARCPFAFGRFARHVAGRNQLVGHSALRFKERGARYEGKLAARGIGGI